MLATKTFARGDLHIEDEDEIHSPHINEGEDCICLVMTQGPLKMQRLGSAVTPAFNWYLAQP